MNILIIANHYPVCSARYAADAFTRLGHNARHVGQPMGRNIWGMQVPEQYVWEPDAPLDKYDSLGEWANDLALIVVMDSDPQLLDFAGRIAGYHSSYPLTAKTVIWGVDNHVRDYRRPYFDHYFLAHKSVSVMDWDEVNTDIPYAVTSDFNPTCPPMHMKPHADMTWLPCAYDPIAFPPSPIPWEQRAYDVCMIGVMYPQRWALVNAMRAAGLKVLAGTGLVYDAYRGAYHNSRVALVSSACGDLPIRLFEGAGMGCAVLCDEIADLEMLDEDPPSWMYYDHESCVFKARELQAREDVATYCQAWAQQHAWEKRAEVILNWLEARS